mgnify:CR=1 FL=1
MDMTPYDKGAKAFSSGKSESDNPYDMHDDYSNFQSWLGGWLSGLYGVIKIDSTSNELDVDKSLQNFYH